MEDRVKHSASRRLSRRSGLSLSALVAIGGALALSESAIADPVAGFYENKRVRVVIGFTVGGGYDLYARLLARHMGTHIPGKPELVPQNMPGAGSMVAMNYVYNGAPKDGTVFGTVSRGVPFEPQMGNATARFDPLAFNWIGSLAKEVNVTIAWHTASVKTYHDLFTRGMIAGGTGTGADSVIYAAVMNNLLGAKISLIAGYPGGADVNLAMERGEIEGRTSPSWGSLRSAQADWVRDKKVVPIWQFALNKHADLPDVPLVLDLVQRDEDKKLLRLIFARQEMSRPFMAPPDVPADRVAALRRAFMATTRDVEFRAAAAKQDLELNPIGGEEVHALLAEAYSAPPALVARMRELAKSAVPTKQAAIRLVKVKAPLTEIANRGASIRFVDRGKDSVARVSNSRTKVSIGGQPAKRANLKEGMVCEIEFAGNGSEASSIVCD